MDAGDRLMLDSVLGHQRSRRYAVRGMTAQDLRNAEQAGPTGFRRFGAPKSAPGLVGFIPGSQAPRAVADEYVDIYLSAGPRDNYGTAEWRSCNNSNALDLPSLNAVTVHEKTTGHGMPAYPLWLDTNVLWFDTSREGSCGDNMSTGWLALPFAGLEAPIVGDGSGIHEKTSYADARYHENPRGIGEGRIVTFGGQCGAHKPRVTNFYGEEKERFDLDSTDADFEECHHPDWNPSGNAILCTRHQQPEDHPETSDVKVRRLFKFTYDEPPLHGGFALKAWRTDVSNADSFVAVLGIDGFDKIPENGVSATGLFPRLGSTANSCKNYVWKFGEWCGRDDYVVATTFCSDADAVDPEQTLRSRVVLINLSEDTRYPTAYVDLVSLIEDYVALSDASVIRGSYDGVFSTCTDVFN